VGQAVALLAQDYPNQLIVVDDGTDGSRLLPSIRASG
jgi:hypothetical protein